MNDIDIKRGIHMQNKKNSRQVSNKTNKTNQGKNQVKNQTKKKTKKKSKKNQSKRLTMKVLILVGLVLIDIIAVVLYMKYGRDVLKMQSEAKETVSVSTIDTFRQSETSIVYDANGKVLSRLKGEKDVYYIGFDDIPKAAKEAVIAIEDKKYYKHKGIDLKANIRALTVLIRNKGEIKQGASTITQQLSRNVFLTQEVTFTRKMKEIFTALELEKKYSKNQLLEFYLNNIYFANGYYGIQAASVGYFSKSVSELSLSQIAFLCAIPNNPTLYDPDQKLENTLKRRDRILDQMYEGGYITIEECRNAKEEEITLKRRKQISKKNYIETYVYYCATVALMKNQGFQFQYSFESEEEQEEYDARYNEMYNQCRQSLYTGGYRIYTSIDQEKQKILQTSINNQLKAYKDKNDEGIYQLQAAATCIDNETGYVVAIVGGRSQKTVGYTLNRAYQSFRQPGSAIKPLIVYTPSLERNYNLDSIVEDKKIEDGPRNSSGVYSGKITLKKAVEQSKNSIAWQLFDELTPKVGLSYLLNMNFSKIDKNDYYLASSLGGFTNGVNTVEMASGYATIENDGVYREPTCIVKITDSKGNEIVRDPSEERPIYEINASRMMTAALVGVIDNGTGRGLKIRNMSTAGKTGTTNDKKDGWFVGYTPYYTTSVWVGYDIPKTLYNLWGSTYPGRIWYDFMVKIHEGLTNIPFENYIGNNVSPTKDSTEEELPENSEEESDDINQDLPLENVDESSNNQETKNKPTKKPINNNSKTEEDLENESDWDNGMDSNVGGPIDNSGKVTLDDQSNDNSNGDYEGDSGNGYDEDTTVYPDDELYDDSLN